MSVTSRAGLNIEQGPDYLQSPISTHFSVPILITHLLSLPTTGEVGRGLFLTLIFLTLIFLTLKFLTQIFKTFLTLNYVFIFNKKFFNANFLSFFFSIF